MATTHHNQQHPPMYRVSHFTPQSRPHWCWIIMVTWLSLSGRQPTITGETADVGKGITLWCVLPGAPSFASQAEAARWAELMQLPNLVIDTE